MYEIETERLLLRNWTQADCPDLFEYGKSRLVGPAAGWPPHKTMEESREFIDIFIRNDDGLAVELKSEGKVIGGVGLHHRTPDQMRPYLKQREIGYVLNPDYWGNGYIPEAVTGLLEIGFRLMKLDLIWCGHFEDNYKSRRVNEKCGFHFCFKKNSTLRLLDNKRVVTWYYNLSKEQYLNIGHDCSGRPSVFI